MIRIFKDVIIVDDLLGRHTVEILHNGQAIMGSPFFVEIYDPNKIRIEGTRTGTVNERMEFDSKLRDVLL